MSRLSWIPLPNTTATFINISIIIILPTTALTAVAIASGISLDSALFSSLSSSSYHHMMSYYAYFFRILFATWMLWSASSSSSSAASTLVGGIFLIHRRKFRRSSAILTGIVAAFCTATYMMPRLMMMDAPSSSSSGTIYSNTTTTEAAAVTNYNVHTSSSRNNYIHISGNYHSAIEPAHAAIFLLSVIAALVGAALGSLLPRMASGAILGYGLALWICALVFLMEEEDHLILQQKQQKQQQQQHIIDNINDFKHGHDSSNPSSFTMTCQLAAFGGGILLTSW